MRSARSLWSDAASGETLDAERVYRTYGPRCYALALRVVRDQDLAQDVIRDVFGTLHRHPDRFDPAREGLSTWLMTLTHHNAVDVIRARRRQPRPDAAGDGTTVVADFSASAEEPVGGDEERARVLGSLRRLNAGEQQVILMAYFDGYSQSDIADRLGISLGTVKSRTLSGMRQMQRDPSSAVIGQDLQSSLDGRVLIEQARGMVAASGGIDMSKALDQLRGYATEHGIGLEVLARQVMDGHVQLEAITHVR